MPHKVAIIVGSTRPNNIGTHIAQWVEKTIESFREIELSLIKLADWNLPFLDEPDIPAQHSYQHEHTKAWSKRVSSEDAFIFVTPQYNWGYPASLKNAIDYLYKEWNGKHALIISYGGHGGNKSALQLRQVLEGGCKMKLVEKMPALTLTPEMIKDQVRIHLDRHFDQYGQEVHQAVQQFIADLDAKERLNSGGQA